MRCAHACFQSTQRQALNLIPHISNWLIDWWSIILRAGSRSFSLDSLRRAFPPLGESLHALIAPNMTAVLSYYYYCRTPAKCVFLMEKLPPASLHIFIFKFCVFATILRDRAATLIRVCNLAAQLHLWGILEAKVPNKRWIFFRCLSQLLSVNCGFITRAVINVALHRIARRIILHILFGINSPARQLYEQ